MSQSPASNNPPNIADSDAELAPTSPGSVDQIRDILFGRQMTEYEDRFQQLEQRLVEENRRLAESTNERIDAALAELEKERQQRASAFEDIVDRLSKQNEDLESARSVTEHQLLERINSQGEEMIERIKETAERESKRHQKIRSLFKNLANQLDEEP